MYQNIEEKKLVLYHWFIKIYYYRISDFQEKQDLFRARSKS